MEGMPRKDVLRELFEVHIQNTPPGAAVVEKTVFLCGLTNAVAHGLDKQSPKIYATSRFLKHLYDKKPAEEFDFILDHLHQVVTYPETIFRNKAGKRGDWCLTRTIGNATYLASLEMNSNSENPGLYVATAFRVRDAKYLDGYELLWSWRSDRPSS
jgi:hypothetical protein